MKRLVTAVVVVILVGVLAIDSPPPDTSAQDGTGPTIVALETRVADLEATVDARGDKINAQRTQIADLEATIGSNSPTATATAERTKPEETEPIPLTNATELLYYYFATDDRGEASLFGEIRNTTDDEIVSPYVRFTLLDADGNIVSTVDASPLFPFIAPQKTVPISAGYLDVKPTEWESEEITACGDVYTDPAPPGLSIEDVEETRKEPNALTIEGKVRNDGNTPASGVKVVAVMYREDGRFGGHGVALIQSEIPSGKTARFELSAYGSDMAGIAEEGSGYTYDVVASLNNVAAYTCSS